MARRGRALDCFASGTSLRFVAERRAGTSRHEPPAFAGPFERQPRDIALKNPGTVRTPAFRESCRRCGHHLAAGF